MPPENHSLKNDYRILGLQPGARPAEVKRAYRALAKICHPDRFHSMPYETRVLAEEKFKQINEAYGRITRSSTERPGSAHSTPKAAPKAPRREWRGRGAAERAWQRSWKRPSRDFPASAISRALLSAAIVLLLLFQSGEDRFVPREREPQTTPVQEAMEKTGNRQGSLMRPVPRRDEPVPPERADPLPEGLLSENTPAVEPPSHLMEFPPDPFMSYFTIGSPSSDVMRVQGPPSRTQGQTWVYGLSEIHFRQGLVWSYNNFDGSLKVRMLPRFGGDTPAPPYFSLDSTEDDVLRVQGTPTRVDPGKWSYGFSEISFKEGRVVEFNNYFGNLKVRLQPRHSFNPVGPKAYFTIGSTQDEVIAVQGTPTSIRGSVWTYNFSHVYFRDGKVSSVSNTESILRFISREDIQNNTAGNS